MTVAAAIIAGGVGALARYGLGGAVQRRTASTRPWGTATVNLTGALLVGLLVGLHSTGHAGSDLLLVASSGFVGGFTTFSTWMVETVRLTEQGGRSGITVGLINLLGLFTAGLAGAAAGVWLTI